MARRPTRTQRLKRLLEAGCFPEELPPPFVSKDLGRYRALLRREWPNSSLQKFMSEPEPFSIPRFGRARRRLAIVNPVSHFLLSELIANNWGTIRAHLASSTVSEFQPIFDLMGQRALFEIDFGRIEVRTNEILANYHYSIKTDITRFYPTIYTHSIAWALHGKQYCKANLRSPAFKSTLGNLLDKAVRNCQDNHSIGLPVGPDTSRVLGEIIGVAIEKELANLVDDFNSRALRYVDDLVVGYGEKDSAEGLLSAIAQAIGQFGLDINFDKTTTLGSSEEVGRDWVSALRQMRVTRRTQQEQLEHFFKAALHLATENERDAVMVYAIKRSRSFVIAEEHRVYYVNWLLRCARKYPACLPAIAQILIENRHLGQPLPTTSVRRFIVDMIGLHGPVQNFFEVSWALFLAKGLGISLPRERLDFLFSQESSVCGLLLMDLNNRGLINGGLDMSYWVSLCAPDTLKKSMWLLVYEGTLKGWLPKTVPCFVEADQLFGPMLRRRIKFYDERRNVPSTRNERKLGIRSKKLSQAVFSNLMAYF